MPKILVLDDLTIAVDAAVAVRITPSQGFRLAQTLVRKSTRRLIDEEGRRELTRVAERRAGATRNRRR